MSRNKLDAINTCLRGIGLSPVATETDPDLDAGLASQVIDKVSHDLQSAGWWFNKEGNWKLTPDPVTGYISAPLSALSIIPSGASRSAGLTIRGTKIYDTWNHTFDLRDRAGTEAGSTTEFIEFTFITELPFAEMPPTARQAVSYVARRLFAQDMEVDEKRYKFQKIDEDLAMINLQREETKNKKRNAITDNSVISSFISRVGGFNARSGYSLNYPKRDQIR